MKAMSESNVTMRSVEFDRSTMFEQILQADPSFHETWGTLQKEYGYGSDLPVYLALSALARHLIQNLEAGETNRFATIFDIVERWHIAGDPYVKEAATIGLLEALQNGYLHRTTRSDDFLPWLRPETLEYWNKLHAYWATGKP